MDPALLFTNHIRPIGIRGTILFIMEIPATIPLSAVTNQSDTNVILEGLISHVSSAIAVAKSADSSDYNACLDAGIKLMNSTKMQLQQVKDLAGAESLRYQVVANSLAEQILQNSIFYNYTSIEDVKSLHKAMVLVKYAMQIATGRMTKQRCQDNYTIIRRFVNNASPVSVYLEAGKINDELRKFYSSHDKIAHSITLLNNTQPQLQTIKTKLGANNSFYLSLSTQVISSALHNILEEVIQAKTKLGTFIELTQKCNLTYVDSDYITLLNVARESWNAITIMNTFDMEFDFRSNRYHQYRQSIKDLCIRLGILTDDLSTRDTSSSNEHRLFLFIAIMLSIIIFIILIGNG